MSKKIVSTLLPEIIEIRSKILELQHLEHEIQLQCKHEGTACFADLGYDGKDTIMYNCNLCDFCWVKEL